MLRVCPSAGGVYSLRGLILNVIEDKAAWCKQFGISMKAEAWSCDKLPATLVTDMGSEYKSENFEQIAELGVKVINLPAYRPELKGMVEKFFDVIQATYKKHLKGKGVIEPDYQERGAHDYRKDACMTMTDFEKIIIHCIIYYNSQRIVENFPYTEAMITENVKPYASCIWNWGKSQMGANLIEVGTKELIMDSCVTVGDFLHSQMANTQYRSVRGEQRNIALFLLKLSVNGGMELIISHLKHYLKAARSLKTGIRLMRIHYHL